MKKTTTFLCCSLGVAAMGGCGSEPRVLSPSTPGTTTAAPAPKIELTPILGAKTTEVRDVQKEMATGGAEAAATRITAKDPITLQGNAYVVSVGKIAVDQITYALRIFEATNERYPKDLDEFMKEIIQANNIALPKLPYYQEYGYDAPNHRLMVLEYPDRKEAFQKQQDERFGRN
jgi:hypothetical protein